MGFEQGAKTDHDLLSVCRRHARPDAGIEGGARHFYGAISVCRRATGDLGQQTAIDRAQTIEGFPVDGVGIVPTDKRTPFNFQGLCASFPSAKRWIRHVGAIPLCRCQCLSTLPWLRKPGFLLNI
ncbi:hypothetical protein D9M71_584790 [compost metagenome]